MSFYGNKLINFNDLENLGIEQSTEQPEPESGSLARVKYTCKFNNGEIGTFTIADGWQLKNVKTIKKGDNSYLEFTFLNSTGTVVVDNIPLSNLIGFKTNQYFNINLADDGKTIEITPTDSFITNLCHVTVNGEKLIFKQV